MAKGNKKTLPTVTRVFNKGDEVTRYRPTRSKRVNKLAPLQEGPFEVTEALENGVSYKAKRIGSDEAELKVHVDDLNAFKRSKCVADSQEERSGAQAEGGSGGKKHQVVEIMDEKGRGTAQHKYLMRWDGTSEDGSPWKCTWWCEQDLDCHLLVMDWEMASVLERGRRRMEAQKLGVVASVRRSGAVKPLKLDIAELVKHPERGTIMCQICDILSIDMSEILFVWASPPCETFTKLDATNVTRGNEHRNHKSATREPRSTDTCHKAAHFVKRAKAILHDQLVTGVVQGFLEDNRHEQRYEYALENPHGMLAERPYMQSAEWVRAVVRHLVHYCNYGGQFHKPTHIWTSLTHWVAGGKSGCGQCCQSCNVGRWKWVDHSVRKKGIQYVHDKQIGGPNDKKGTEGGSQKQQRWNVPESLLSEIVESIPKKDERKRYIIDLFAGKGSMRRIAERGDYIYVPVDIIDRSAEGRNARNERKKSLARICCNGETNRLLKMTWAS